MTAPRRRSFKIVREPSGEWHFGVWKTNRCISLRLFKRSLVYYWGPR